MKVIHNVLLLIIIVYTVDAQVIPKVPEGLRYDGHNVTVCYFQWNKVIEADYYLVDVAEDSLFTKILPGMKDCPVLQPQDNQTTVTFIVYNILLEKAYYCRVRAANKSGTSVYSQVLRIFNNATGLGNSLARIDAISDSSITVVWSPIISTVKEFKQFSLSVGAHPVNIPPPLPTVKIPPPLPDGTYRVEVSGLAAGKPHAVFFLQEVGVSNQIISPVTTISREWAGIKKFVSYNEFRRVFVMPKTPADSLKYYTLISYSVNKPSHKEVDSLLTIMRKVGIPFDTVWFHEGGFYWVGLGRSNNAIVSTGLTIKLQKPDARMAEFGFRNGFAVRDYSNEFLYYRYDISGTTGVETEPKASDGEILRIAPNPVGEIMTVHYKPGGSGELYFEIYDILGRLWLRKKEYPDNDGKSQSVFDTSQLPKGCYTLNLSTQTASGITSKHTHLFFIVR